MKKLAPSPLCIFLCFMVSVSSLAQSVTAVELRLGEKATVSFDEGMSAIYSPRAAEIGDSLYHIGFSNDDKRMLGAGLYLKMVSSLGLGKYVECDSVSSRVIRLCSNEPSLKRLLYSGYRQKTTAKAMMGDYYGTLVVAKEISEMAQTTGDVEGLLTGYICMGQAMLLP